MRVLCKKGNPFANYNPIADYGYGLYNVMYFDEDGIPVESLHFGFRCKRKNDVDRSKFYLPGSGYYSPTKDAVDYTIEWIKK